MSQLHLVKDLSVYVDPKSRNKGDARRLSLTDIAWLAGLLEGEGAFMDNKSSPCIALAMTDRDVVEKALRIMDTYEGLNPAFIPRKAPWKPVWKILFFGARAAGWMMTLYPLMGKRRKSRIRAILERWKQQPGFPRGHKGERFSAICHANRPRYSNGLCRPCYMKQWHSTPAECHPAQSLYAKGMRRPCYTVAFRLNRISENQSKLL